MNLWDLSASSPLIRHDLLKQDRCWESVDGLKVHTIENIGKFAHVQFPDNGSAFYVYKRDLKNWVPFKEPKTSKVANVELRLTSVKKVSNTHEFGVTLINKKPTVNITLAGPSGLIIDIGVVKEVIRSGYVKQISDQRGSEMQAGGTYKTVGLGLGGGSEYVKFSFIRVDTEKKIAEIEVEGYWNNVASTNLTVKPSRLEISGKNFAELMRPHTALELQKVIE